MTSYLLSLTRSLPPSHVEQILNITDNSIRESGVVKSANCSMDLITLAVTRTVINAVFWSCRRVCKVVEQSIGVSYEMGRHDNILRFN